MKILTVIVMAVALLFVATPANAVRPPYHQHKHYCKMVGRMSMAYARSHCTNYPKPQGIAFWG